MAVRSMGSKVRGTICCKVGLFPTCWPPLLVHFQSLAFPWPLLFSVRRDSGLEMAICVGSLFALVNPVIALGQCKQCCGAGVLHYLFLSLHDHVCVRSALYNLSRRKIQNYKNEQSAKKKVLDT